jgi:hypothetical protein
MPVAVAARPRDERGYPVPAITPWEDGQPRFAATGTARSYICAVERRCSICATPMPAGPVYRVISGDEADAIESVLANGGDYVNQAATVEAPGHRACMLYAAVACPYLARPTARRGQDGVAVGLESVRGDRRGLGGAVAGFDELEFRYLDVVLFRFRGLREFRRHDLGEEQLEALSEAIAAGQSRRATPPNYLMSDESAADRRFARLLASTNGGIARTGR